MYLFLIYICLKWNKVSPEGFQKGVVLLRHILGSRGAGFITYTNNFEAIAK